MLVVDPERDDEALERGLMEAAEGYLRGRGAQVIYAGGQAPVNPFYWGIYGGSECAGMLSSHVAFHRAAQRSGYEPVANTVLLQADLAQPEPRDPKGVVLRRQTRLEVARRRDHRRLVGVGRARPVPADRCTACSPATATASWPAPAPGRWPASAGSTAGSTWASTRVEVAPDVRRQGYGRHLVGEVMRKARSQWNEVIDVQTRATNLPALGLYESLGFVRVETATLYRRPG